MMRHATILILLTALLTTAAVWSAEQIALDSGVFFEAEDYNGQIYGEGFGKIIDEPLASGNEVIIKMWQKGAVSFELSVPKAGTYNIWIRYGAPGEAQMKYAFDTIDAGKFRSTKLPKTADRLDAQDAYQWCKIGEVKLEGEHALFIVGQGALRHDCYLFSPKSEFEASDDILAEIEKIRTMPTGKELPELTHDRKITDHPEWLKHALRPCYAHFEWDRDMTADKWCKHAAKAGANCIIGAGEMPAGTLNGELKKFSWRHFNRTPDFEFPKGYKFTPTWAKDFVDAAHDNGMKIAIYGGAMRTVDPLLVEHPEWRQVNRNGRPTPHGFGCWHSPYRQAYIQRWVDAAKLSGFDGIMIDMFFTGPKGGDYSEYTVNAFKEKSGVKPPRKPDPRNLTWQRWIDFQNWTREEVLLDLTEALHEVDPEIAVIINQTEGWIFNRTDNNFLTSRAADCVDGLLEEMGWDFRHDWQRPWAWPLMSAWQNLYLHCRTRPGYGQMWHCLLNYPEAHVKSLSYSMLANGTAPAVVTGSNWPIMSRVWQHTKACEPSVEETKLLPWMALHFSENTLDWYADAKGEETYTAYMKNVFGFFRAALELHLPIEIITDDDLKDPATLQRYATICLPNSACLSDAQTSAVAEFVENGGGLVASYETGRYDENGIERGTPALQDLFGVTQFGPVTTNSWRIPLREPDHEIMDHEQIRTAGDWNQGQSVRANSGYIYTGPNARTVGAVGVSPPPQDAFSVRLIGAGSRQGADTPKQASWKSLIAREADQGRVVFFPVDIGHAFYVFNHPLNRHLIGQSLEWAAGYVKPFRTNAPMAVQSVPYSRGDARVVHLVNDNSSFGRAAAPNPEAFTAFRAEVNPVENIRIAVKGEYSTATLLPADEKLTVQHADGFTGTMVPRIDVHGVVVFGR